MEYSPTTIKWMESMKEKKAESYLIEMRGISKVFPGVQALDNVDFYIEVWRDPRPLGR